MNNSSTQESKKPHSFLRMNVRPWGLLAAVGAVGCCATIFGCLGRFFWLLDMFSHFRVQYFLALSIVGLLLLFSKHRKTAALFVVFAGVNLGFFLPLYFGGQAAAPEEASSLRALLLNVNTRHGDPERVKQVIQESEPDIVVLEEISEEWVEDLQWLIESHPHSVIRPRRDNFGIALFSKLPIEESEIVYIGGIGVPSIVATLDTGGSKLCVIATHPVPAINADYSKRRNDQLDSIPDYVPSDSPVLLLGDLNTTPWNYYFKRLLKRSGLMDSSKGRGIQTSWPNNNRLLSIPLDHCLHSPDILVTQKQIGSDVGSDHYPVVVDFSIMTEEKKY